MKRDMDEPDDEMLKKQHMTRRYQHHKSFRKLADEFGLSKSQAHRIVRDTE